MPRLSQKTAAQRLRVPRPMTRQMSLLSNDGKCFSNYADLPRQRDSENRTFSMVQTVVNTAFITSSVALNTYNVKQFQFNDIDQYSSLALVFDQYRIAAIEVYLTESGANANLSNDGKLTSVIDFDDVTVLTGTQAYDYSNAVTTSGASGHYRHFIPHVAVAAYSGAFTSFANQPAPWIDTSSPGVAHYGLKTMITPTSTVKTIDLVYRLHVQLRSVR